MLKSLIVRFAGALFGAFVLIAALWTLIGYVMVRGMLEARSAQEAGVFAAATANGRGLLNRNTASEFIRSIQRRSDTIVALAAARGSRAAGGPQSGMIVWPLPIGLPIVSDGDITWLQAGVNPSVIIDYLLRPGGFLMVMFGILATVLVFVGAAVIATRRYVITPLTGITRAIDAMLREEPAPSIHAPFAYRSIVRSVSELRARLEDDRAVLNQLFASAQTLSANQDPTSVYYAALDIVQRRFGGTPSAVVIDGEDGFLKVRASRGWSGDFAAGIARYTGSAVVPSSYGSLDSVVVNDIAFDSSPLGRLCAAEETVPAYAVLPLAAQARCAGLLIVGGWQAGFFTPERLRTLRGVGRYLSVNLWNSELYQKVRELNYRLENEVASTSRELTQTNARLIRNVRELTALQDIAQSVSRTRDTAASLQRIVHVVRAVFAADYTAIYFFDPLTDALVLPQGGCEADGVTLCADASGFRVTDEAGTLGRILTCGESMFTQEPPAHPPVGIPAECGSFFAVPLATEISANGVLVAGFLSPRRFSDDDRRFAAALGRQAAMVMENIHLSERVARQSFGKP